MEQVAKEVSFDQQINPHLDLAEILAPLLDLPRHLNRPVTNIASNSRAVKPGAVFFACSGCGLTDGRDFIQDAVISGAVAVVSEIAESDTVKTSLIMPPGQPNHVVPHIQIPGLRSKLGKVAAVFYNYPARQMQLVGITGTNGKTTVATLLTKALHTVQSKTGFIGTHGVGSDLTQLKKTQMTTPGPLELQEFLQNLAALGCENIAMEVSSHAIAQHRVVGVDFDTLVLTNISRDHLDYHKNIEEYVQIKERLFLKYPTRTVVFNLDDPAGYRLAQRLCMKHKVISYSTKGEKVSGAAALLASQIRTSTAGLSMVVAFGAEKRTVKTQLIGDFNVSNILAVVASMLSLGYDFQTAISAVQGFTAVGGRMETITLGKDKPTVVIDYAHSPSALEAVLQNLRQAVIAN